MKHPLSQPSPLDGDYSQVHRRKSLLVTPELLLEMLKVPEEGVVIGDRRVFPDKDAVPLDATVAQVRITDRGYIQLDIESEEFPETHSGDQLMCLRPVHRVEFLNDRT